MFVLLALFLEGEIIVYDLYRYDEIRMPFYIYFIKK
jgi:hypothetical protein